MTGRHEVHPPASIIYRLRCVWPRLVASAADDDPGSIATCSPPARLSAVSLLTVMHRFAPLGVALVAVVSITGLINAQLIFGLENSATTLKTSAAC